MIAQDDLIISGWKSPLYDQGIDFSMRWLLFIRFMNKWTLLL